MTFNLHVISDCEREHLYNSLLFTGASKSGASYMLNKGLHYALMAEGLSLSATLILKQEALSKGAECSINEAAVTGEKRKYDVLMMATVKQYRMLAENLKNQDFKLKILAQEILELLANIEIKKWQIPYDKGLLELGGRTLVMGILNLTPDSFYDGGQYVTYKSAIERAYQMAEEGADIIDIGGASSRPGFTPVPVEEELKRVIPVIEEIAKEISLPISIDSDKAEVAEAALNGGASIINDIRGLQGDPMMVNIAKNSGAPVIIMHQGGDEKNLFGEMIAYFRNSFTIAKDIGVGLEKLIIDPGIGFGKSLDQNLEIIRYLSELKSLGRPILMGTSNKSLIGKILDLAVEERMEGTAATVAFSIANGAAIVRVHDVKAMKKIAVMSDAIMGRK